MKMNKRYSLGEYAEMINAELLRLMPECGFGEDVVCEAMKYSTQIGGKRIRPVLTLEFCRICGGDINDALPLAAAIEMIHTYSLIHDDLPCMDNDDMRRGRPSCHIKFGESYALLAGDGLLTYAFEVISSSDLAVRNPAAAVKAVRILSQCAGVCGMIGGQVVDLKSEGKQVGLDTLNTMHSLKTGALIKAAALLGTAAAGADEEKTRAAAEYAENLGRAFQIVDDILDVTADEESLGKPVGSDEISGKSTYVTLLGLEESQKEADRLTEKAVAILSVFGEEGEFLKRLSKELVSRKK